MTKVAVAVEIADKKAFAYALGWPGWCRAGRDEATALEALLAASPRYAEVAARARVPFPDRLVADDLEVLERVAGGSGTTFGVPSSTADADRGPVDALEAARLANLVAAAWQTFDAVRGRSPETLRKGPRGGGRDRDKMAAHVMGADSAYATELGRKHPAPAIDDDAAIEAMRTDMLQVLGSPSDGQPLAGRKWLHRYAARRVAWHALDHAWEMEDRAEPDEA
jgi:hypothetical protein